MAVEVGAEFDSYDDLTNAIRLYEAENYVNLTTRDTRTVEAAAKRNLRKNYNSAIKYSDISYCCTYGGKKYVCHSTGKRNHKSIKQACPFSLKVRATIDGQRLFIREMCSLHNHPLTEAEFRLHPKQRKLDIGSQEEIAHLLSMEPDKKLLRDKLMQITGKVILMKDIHNIKTRLLNPRARQKDIKAEFTERDEEEDTSDENKVREKDTAEMETQTENENPEEIHIPVSHVTSAQIDTSHQSILFHQPDNLIDSEVQNCYIDNQTYQQQTASVYTVNVQAFQPTQVYTVSPHPFQPTSTNIIHDSIVANSQQIDPAVIDGSQHFQHWAPLEDVGHQAVQEANYQAIGTFAYHDQQQSTTYPTHQQHRPVPISNSEPVFVKDISTSHLHQEQEEHESLHRIRHSRKRPVDSIITPKKRKSAEQTDKEMSLRKYFQQAAVNLFFNERLKSPGSKLFQASRLGTVPAKMSEDLKFHDLLKPLSWLFGKWQSTEGKGIYPNIADFTYAEEAMFMPVGMKPVVEYSFDITILLLLVYHGVQRMHSWKTDNKMPMHRESGYIKIKPNTNHIAFVAAHIMGVVEIQEGEINGQELCVESNNIGRTSFNSPPEVKLVKRFLRRTGNELEQVIDMQTDKTAITEHLRITFKKVD